MEAQLFFVSITRCGNVGVGRQENFNDLLEKLNRRKHGTERYVDLDTGRQASTGWH